MATADELKALGNSAFKEGRFGEAVDQFSKAIELDPSSHTLFSNRSGALAALGRYDAALVDAEATIAINPSWAKGFSRKGAALYGLGRYDDALMTYEAGLAADPSSAQMAQAAADVKLKQVAARQLLEAAAAGNLEAVRTCLRSGVQPDGSTMDFANGSSALLVAAEAGHAEVVAELVGAKADLRRVNVAGESAAALARRSPAPDAVLASLGEGGSEAAPKPGAKKGSFFSGMGEKARLAAEKAKAAANEAMSSVKQKADDLKREREKAAEAQREANAVRNAEAEASRFEAAEAEAKAKAEAEARAEGARVAAEAEAVVAAQAAEEQAAFAAAKAVADQAEKEEMAQNGKQQGNDAFKEGRYQEAVKYYSQAIECDQTSAVLYSNRSGALAASGSYEVALADAERCIALEPQWAKGHTRKAASLHGLKRYLAAVQAYDEALKFEPGAEALLLGRRQSSFALAIEE